MDVNYAWFWKGMPLQDGTTFTIAPADLTPARFWTVADPPANEEPVAEGFTVPYVSFHKQPLAATFTFRLLTEADERALWDAVGQVIAEYATRRDLWIALNKRFSQRIRNQRTALRRLEQERNDLRGWREHAQYLEAELEQEKRAVTRYKRDAELAALSATKYAQAFHDLRAQVASSPYGPRFDSNPLYLVELPALLQQIDTLRAELNAARNEAAEAQTKLRDLAMHTFGRTDRETVLAAENAELRQELEQANAELAEWKNGHAALGDQCETLRAEKRELERELTSAGTANRFLRERVASLEARPSVVQPATDPTADYWKARAQSYARQLDAAGRDSATLRDRIERLRAVLDGKDGDADA